MGHRSIGFPNGVSCKKDPHREVIGTCGMVSTRKILSCCDGIWALFPGSVEHSWSFGRVEKNESRKFISGREEFRSSGGMSLSAWLKLIEWKRMICRTSGPHLRFMPGRGSAHPFGFSHGVLEDAPWAGQAVSAIEAKFPHANFITLRECCWRVWRLVPGGFRLRKNSQSIIHANDINQITLGFTAELPRLFGTPSSQEETLRRIPWWKRLPS